MASRCRLVLVLFYAWSWRVDATRVSALARRHASGTHASAPDTLTEHMQTLYAKYNRDGHAFKDGNTVRSFKAQPGFLGGRRLLVFNLTSLTRSESVLSVTLHFFTGDPPQRSKRQRQGGRLPLDVWSFGSDHGRALGHVRFDVSAEHRGAGHRGAWQWRDVTRVVGHAKGQDELLVGVDPGPHKPYPPYVLVYANDSAISEPESLRRHHLPALETALHRQQNSSKKTPRHRRAADPLSPLQNNELPGPEYPRREYPGSEYPGGEYPRREYPRREYPRREYPTREYPYKPQNWEPVEQSKAQNPRRAKKKSSKAGAQKGALLQFDERTLKKARRKWAEPRSCARRHLKVDFADIGWNDWIISPKSYDAFYCGGSCQFPMAKVLKPSNHATIQSIVRAVGVVPGVPEPCCVPEKMSSLSILFFDEQANVVLKVYPNMSVESCACR